MSRRVHEFWLRLGGGAARTTFRRAVIPPTRVMSRACQLAGGDALEALRWDLVLDNRCRLSADSGDDISGAEVAQVRDRQFDIAGGELRDRRPRGVL